MHRLVLRELLNPRQWRAPEDRKFHLDAEQINELCDAAERIFKEEPSVLRLRGMFCTVPTLCMIDPVQTLYGVL